MVKSNLTSSKISIQVISLNVTNGFVASEEAQWKPKHMIYENVA